MTVASRYRIAALCALLLGLAGAVGWAMLHRTRNLESVLAMARRDFPNVPRIGISRLRSWLAEPLEAPPQVFDVRTPAEYAVSCIPGAQRLDPNIRVKSARGLINPGRRAVYYCSTGYRSSALVAALQDAGVTNIYNLEGSLFAWANADLPLEDPQTHRPAKFVHPFSDSYANLLKPGLAARVSFAESASNEIAFRERLRMGLAAALLIILLVWESFAPMYLWFQSRPTERVLHGLRNITLGLLNTLVVATLFVSLWLWASHWAQDNGFGLLNGWDMPAAAHSILAFILLDAWTYAWHRLNHGLPFLWRFHRMHHSEPQLDVTSATRFHFGEISLSAVLRIPVILLFGIRFGEMVIYESVLFAIVQFQHANIKLPQRVEALLGLIIVTPNFHRVHHSKHQPQTDSNYSSLLCIWDRVFGTRGQCNDPWNLELGLAEFRDEAQTLGGMLQTPVKRADSLRRQ